MESIFTKNVVVVCAQREEAFPADQMGYRELSGTNQYDLDHN